MANASCALLEGLDAVRRGSITEALSGYPLPRHASAHLDKAARLIQCAEVIAEIVYGDEISRDSMDDYEGLKGFRRGALLAGVVTMLEDAGQEMHMFAASCGKLTPGFGG